MTSETRYMRSDQHTINGLTAYKLSTTQSASSIYASRTIMGEVSGYWGIRVWKRPSGGVETEITSGSPVAIVSRSSDGYGLQSNTWSCPQTSLESTDAIVVRVYHGNTNPPQYLARTFITEQLNASQLDVALWTVYYYTYRSYDAGTDITTLRFYHGSSGYNSRIEDFTWSSAPLPEESRQHSGTLMGVGIF